MISLMLRMRLFVFRGVLSFFLRVLGLFVKVDRHLILFSSFAGKAYSDNPRYLFEYLRDDERFSDYRFVWTFKTKQVVEGAETVKFNSFKYYFLLSKAKYWVFNAKMAPYYYKRTGQIYLQTWHGTPLKRLGHDIVDQGLTYYRSRQSYQQMVKSYDQDSRHWDYLISPNAFSSQVFTSAFNFKREKMLDVGYPRVDVLVNANVEQIINLKRKYALPEDKKVILYAPTWRDNLFDLSGYKLKLAVDFYQWKKVLGDGVIVLFKPHYLISNHYQVPEDLTDFVVVMRADSDITDAYLMSDILVTDYSSVFFDYAVLGRPIYFYMYDFEQYEQDLRGFYLEVPKDLPNEIVQTEEELLRMIRDDVFDYQRLAHFNQKFNLWNDGMASFKVVKEIFHED